MIVLRLLHTVVAVLVIVLTVLPLAFLVALAGDRPISERILHFWVRIVLVAAGARVVVRQLAPIDPSKSYVFVANHTSHMDVPALLSVSPVPLRFIAKKELRRLPVFGWAAERMGHVFVDRRDSHGASRAISRRIKRGLSGIALFFFAEGTRSMGDELLPFKKGAAIAALQTGLECVPIGIAGAREVFPPGFSTFRPGTIAIVFGAPLSPGGYALERREELVAAQRTAVEAAVREARALLRERAG